jgi:inositol phosphorylceramide mannosyltransferase catalytic subunit
MKPLYPNPTDLKQSCKRNLDPLLAYPAWMPATKIHIGLTNHVMGTVANRPYFHLLISRLQAYNHNWLFPYMTIMNSAGPHFVSMVWEEYLRSTPRHEPHDHDQVRILMQEEFAGNDWSFFTKGKGETWNGWDTWAFRWFSTHIQLFIVICVLGIGLTTASAWWVGWKVAGWLSARAGSVNGARTFVLPVWQKSD